MAPNMVVMDAPIPLEDPHILESGEGFANEKLVLQPPVEVLIESIFPRAAQCNIGRSHTEIVQPVHQFPGS